MRYVYPVVIEQDEDGRYLGRAIDVPEAITDGETLEEALRNMSDALGSALAGYSLEHRALPTPSRARAESWPVPVAPLIAAKLILREAMEDENISNTELARRLRRSEGAVRRLVNPDHASRLDRVVTALNVIGHELIIEDQKQVAA